MPEVVLINIASLVGCAVLIVVIWLRIKSDFGPLKSNGEPHDKQNQTPAIKSGDWFNVVMNVVIGIFLGVTMSASGSWFIAVLIPLSTAVLFFYMSLFDSLIDSLIDKVFPSGIQKPAHILKKTRKTPLANRISFPLGLVLGIFLTAIGLGDWFISLIL
ncbi:hypothetical protein OAA91_00230 [Fibrobacterales bacterium]|nr:hypothetical protein [Fibrobacterales bacterium]